jgi:plasmid stability protein
MTTLQVRNFSDTLHQKIRTAARRDHRSISQQVEVLLAKALDVSLSAPKNRQQVLAAVKKDARRLKKFDVSDPVELIRQDRF